MSTYDWAFLLFVLAAVVLGYATGHFAALRECNRQVAMRVDALLTIGEGIDRMGEQVSWDLMRRHLLDLPHTWAPKEGR